ncbi:hypothetical protein [Brevibacillus fulvus]|uniref:Uncharacterized protein n=1 Tax=Brevibacillus fulvus TaxID=1125967 RepID=A0A938Y1N3_9BACL|nr:hypothetical protein [Brevibacillus fulvus]MBM7590361.1 hypothetical protein [Brevibacillus fulvus]
MNETVVTIIAILIGTLSLVFVYKQIELKVQIKDILNVTLKANKTNGDAKKEKEEPELPSDSPHEKNASAGRRD